jgi:RNA polymerase sigma-70 factor (ECF subfamily)
VLRAGSEGAVLHARPRGGLRLPVADAAQVWEDFNESLLSFIARRVRDRDTAEDILQEVMLRIHRHAGDLDEPSAVAAWVHQIARNAITDHYRRAAHRREQPAGIELGDDRALEIDAADGVARGEIAACLRPLLDELPAGHREALALTELGELSQVDAARQLGISTSGMKSRVQRGRAQLRDLLVACCEINLDRRARITGYEPRGGSCGCQRCAAGNTDAAGSALETTQIP